MNSIVGFVSKLLMCGRSCEPVIVWRPVEVIDAPCVGTVVIKSTTRSAVTAFGAVTGAGTYESRMPGC